MATLLITGGKHEGRLFHLPDDPIVTIGRDDTCSVQIVDPTVSRKHLQIRLDAASGKRIAADYRSANGVRINAKPIIEQELADADRIELGDTVLVYLEADHEDAQSALSAVRKRGQWKRSTIMRPGEGA